MARRTRWRLLTVVCLVVGISSSMLAYAAVRHTSDGTYSQLNYSPRLGQITTALSFTTVPAGFVISGVRVFHSYHKKLGTAMLSYVAHETIVDVQTRGMATADLYLYRGTSIASSIRHRFAATFDHSRSRRTVLQTVTEPTRSLLVAVTMPPKHFRSCQPTDYALNGRLSDVVDIEWSVSPSVVVVAKVVGLSLSRALALFGSVRYAPAQERCSTARELASAECRSLRTPSDTEPPNVFRGTVVGRGWLTGVDWLVAEGGSPARTWISLEYGSLLDVTICGYRGLASVIPFTDSLGTSNGRDVLAAIVPSQARSARIIVAGDATGSAVTLASVDGGAFRLLLATFTVPKCRFSCNPHILVRFALQNMKAVTVDIVGHGVRRIVGWPAVKS